MTILTLSGNEITDAIRALGAEGDGLASPDSSMGIWPAATNLVTNGGFTTNMTDWAATTGTPTLTRITTDSKFGPACLQIDVPNGSAEGAGYGSASTPAPAIGAVWSASAWVKAKTGGDVGKTVSLHLGLIGAVEETHADIVLTAAWQRVTLTYTWTVGGATGFFVHGRYNPAGAVGFLMDGVQVEVSPIATPYIETDGATAARAAARVQVPVAGLFTPTQGWVAARVRMGFDFTTAGLNPAVFDWGTESSNFIRVVFDDAANGWEVWRRATASGNPDNYVVATFAIGTYVTVIAKWTAGGTGISLDGAAFVTNFDANIPDLSADSTIDIGTDTGVFPPGIARELTGDILWFAAGSGTLTDADAAAIHAFGNVGPSLPDLPGAPTLVWPGDTSLAYAASEASVVAAWHQRRRSHRRPVGV